MLALPTVLLAMTPWLSGCGEESAADGTHGHGTVRVVASTDVYGDIAKQVGGSDVTVTSILTNPDQDPHSFEANPRTKLAIAKAEVLIENGGGYDDYMKTLREASDSSAAVIDVVDLSGKAAEGGAELNEHVWYDLPTVQKLATELADQFAAKDSAHASDFAARAKAFNDKVAALIAREAQLRAVVAGKAIAITEPVPLYLTEALGLTNKTPAEFSEAIEEGDDVSPRVLQQTLELFTNHEVSALVYNEQTSGPITEKVQQAAKDAGVPVVPVTETLSGSTDYLTWMSGEMDALGAALGAS
jgi:zinc/manganese transport system substrate-binding protein